MINNIFSKPIFLDLCNNEGQLVGQTPQQIMKHPQETFCVDEKTEEEILKQYKKMNVKYDPADMMQVYLKELQDTRTIRVSLQETVTDRVLIHHVIDQLNKHMDLDEAVEK